MRMKVLATGDANCGERQGAGSARLESETERPCDDFTGCLELGAESEILAWRDYRI